VEQNKVSRRRCCVLVGLSRNTPFSNRRQVENDALLQEIHRLANRYNRFGYRRIHALLSKQQGLAVNVKRVHRLWKQEGLQVRKRKRRKRRGEYTVLIPQQAKSPNHVWTVDFVYDTLRHGRSIRLLSVVDEYTRECLALRVEYALKSEDVQMTLQTLIHDLGRPLYLRSDNGSEFIAKSLQGFLADHGTRPLFIEPGSPWQNGKCESFNGRLRDECLNAEWWGSLREAQNVIEQWREHYNTERPHSALDYWTPKQFADHWYSQNTSGPLPTQATLQRAVI
jgi:putative transposase